MQEPQLQNLMTYTVFHLGVYVTLVAALIGVGVFKDLDSWWLRGAITLLIAAAICGAVVGSQIPLYSTFKEYSEGKIGPWGYKWAHFKTWAFWEHIFSWAAMLLLALPYLWKGKHAFEITAPHLNKGG